jgi:DNA polymerase V
MNKVFPIDPPTPLPIPLYLHRVRAGFPSPADDYLERRLDLNEHVVKHPSATYYVRAQGDSMEQLGIHDGDLLIVDRALEAINGDVVIAVVDGSLACKVLDLRRRQLLSGNPQFPPISILEDMDLVIEGVVTHSLRYHRCSV